jgi:hypothetical protein
MVRAAKLRLTVVVIMMVSFRWVDSQTAAPGGWHQRALAHHRGRGHHLSGRVRRLVLDPLTKTQSRQLREISRRIIRAIDPEH